MSGGPNPPASTQPPASKSLKDGGTVAPVREILWGTSAGVRKYESADELPPEMADLIMKLMVVQSDTEFASIQQHRPWLDSAPTLEDRWVQARIVADEARHALQGCRILRDFGDEGQKRIDGLLRTQEGQHKLDAFNIPFDSWADVGAFTCLVDRVGVYQLRAFQECSYGPLARAMPLMLSEEQLHLNFGYNILRRMVREGERYYGSREEAQRAVNKWFPRALDMFGHSNSRTSRMAIDLGVKRWTNEEARARYLAEVRPLLEGIGLSMPDPMTDRRIL